MSVFLLVPSSLSVPPPLFLFVPPPLSVPPLFVPPPLLFVPPSLFVPLFIYSFLFLFELSFSSPLSTVIYPISTISLTLFIFIYSKYRILWMTLCLKKNQLSTVWYWLGIYVFLKSRDLQIGQDYTLREHDLQTISVCLHAESKNSVFSPRQHTQVWTSVEIYFGE